MFNGLTYAVLEIADLHTVAYSEVIERSANTVRKSLAGDLFTVKWKDTIPSFIKSGLITPVETLTHIEALELMVTPEWTDGFIPPLIV